jgi:hypothetical protein
MLRPFGYSGSIEVLSSGVRRIVRRPTRAGAKGLAVSASVVRGTRASTLLACALGLIGCHASQMRHPTSTPAPATSIAPGPSSGVEHYRIDAQHSEVLILVYRDGPLAALGHNHVLSVGDLSGEVTLPAGATHGPAAPEHVELARFTLEFPVASLLLDEPAFRAQQGGGFEGALDAASIEGTRAHMLGALLLDADHYAHISLQSERVQAEGDHWLARVHIVVRDYNTEAQVPITLQSSGDELIASGEFDLSHAQLGLKPYSVALGALRVAETLHLRYRLIAQRGDSATAAEDP